MKHLKAEGEHQQLRRKLWTDIVTVATAVCGKTTTVIKKADDTLAAYDKRFDDFIEIVEFPADGKQR